MTTGQLIRYAVAKLMYELVGTFMLTLLFLSSDTFSLFLGLWIVTAFVYRVSGAHLNPAISVAFSLRKDLGTLSRKLAICYILAQVLGAILAALTCLWLLPTVPAAIPNLDDGFRVLIQEFLGSFCLVFFFLSQTEEKTVISHIETIHCFVLAAAYIAARGIVCGNTATLSNYAAILNPAIAIGIFLASWFNDIGDAFKWVWLYPTVPFLGAILAVIFFEFVYKKS